MTTTDPFSDPGKGGDRVPLDELVDTLLAFQVHSVEREIETSFGPSDAVKCDVHALDGDHKGDAWHDTLIFPRVLQSQLSGKVGGIVLGRLGKGTAKPGQSAPWQLDDPTDADRQIGMKWWEYQQKQEAPF